MRCASRKCCSLALAYFLVVTGNYGIEFFLPSILERWYGLKLEHADVAGDAAADAGAGGPAGVRLELGPHAGTPVAHGRADGLRRDRPRRCGVVARIAAPDRRMFHGRGGGAEVVPARVLVAAQHLPDRQRRRRQHRVDQLDRQSRRIPRSVHGRQRRVDDRIVRKRPALSRRLGGGRRPHDLPAGDRSA